MSRTNIYVHINILLDFPITYKKNASVLCQSEWACLHQTVNMVKTRKIPTPNGEHLCKCTELSLKQKEGISFVENNSG